MTVSKIHDGIIQYHKNLIWYKIYLKNRIILHINIRLHSKLRENNYNLIIIPWKLCNFDKKTFFVAEQ